MLPAGSIETAACDRQLVVLSLQQQEGGVDSARWLDVGCAAVYYKTVQNCGQLG